jgi:hypothetical protein
MPDLIREVWLHSRAPDADPSPARLVYSRASMGRFARLFVTVSPEHRTLDGFVDSLLQIFENSRPGLTADMLAKGGVEAFCGDLYEKEVRRLREKVTQLSHLSKDEQEEFSQRVDERIRRVVLPAYARLASDFTPRERNDFFLTPDALHGVERLAWAVVGVVLGAVVLWAPFIPLFAKEWMLVFAVGGFAFPSIRRHLAVRRYLHDLNDLVVRTDDEIWRLDLGYLTSAWERGSVVGSRVSEVRDAGLERPAAHPEDASPTKSRGSEPGVREGER